MFRKTSTYYITSFDVELPATCDDEHWEGSTPFQQPVGASSSMDFFNYLLRLHQINSLTLRTMVRH